LGGLLSPESTATSLVSSTSGDTAALLAGASLGSLSSGPSTSTSSAVGHGGLGPARQPRQVGWAAAGRAQTPPATATGGERGPAVAAGRGREQRPYAAVGPNASGAAGSGVSATAITSALRAAAETRSAGATFGELLSPETSSASASASASGEVSSWTPAAAGAGRAGSSSSATGPRAGSGSSSHVPRPAQQRQQPMQQAQPNTQATPGVQQQQQGPGGVSSQPGGLAALLADIVSDDPQLAQQLQQQSLSKHQHQD
jgi:hypothetical protein